MIYLLISILSSSTIFVVFKLIEKYNINTLQVIVANYVTALICGWFLYDGQLTPSEIVKSNWFIVAVGLGFLFIAIFNVMALTAQRNGISVASVASKMSLIIPAVFGIYVYNESAEIQKLLGIGLALVAVYLTSVRKKDDTVLTKSIYLPIILFFGSGIIDTSVNHYAPEGNISLFLSVIFGFSGIIGFALLSYKSIKQKNLFKLKSIPFGILLGIANYCSMHFLLLALRFENTESSTIFTINHIAILALSTIIGLALFKEQISIKNWIGILLAVISIVLVTLA